MENTNPQCDDTFDDPWVRDCLSTLAPESQWHPDGATQLAKAYERRLTRRAQSFRWVTAAIVGAIIFVCVPVTRAFGVRCVEACVSASARVSQLWRADEPEANAPRVVGLGIGDIAPDIVGADAQGTPVGLSSLRGRFVVLNFWATWCAPCRTEIPLLNDIQRQFRQEVAVIGVSLDQDGWAAIAPFVAEQPIGYTVALGNNDVSSAYGGVNELPATFVIDRDGRIVVKRIGVLNEGADYAQLVKLFER